ncbi:hypothetical protein KKG72_10400 [bacterium]|nr:hypothetical protein [bacterium]MBU1994461.1 hypothetical protein [bacterium]
MKNWAYSTLVALVLMLSLAGCSSGGGDSSGDTTDPVVVTGSSALSGTIAQDTSGDVVTAPSRFSAMSVSDIDADASAQLVVDLSKNKIYGDSGDVKYTSVVGVNGSFEFKDVQVNKSGETKAELTVSKNGFAKVTKVVTLTDGQNVSVVAEAGALPVLTEVVSIDRNTTVPGGSYLKLGIKQTSTGLSSYSRIMSLSELHAEATDPSFGLEDVSSSVIPLDTVPPSVTEITADIQAFDPTSEEDSKYFPGEYKGTGVGGSTEERQLVSAAFDLVSLKDQNGDPVVLDNSVLRTSKLLAQADYDNCLQTKVRYLSSAQVTLIENYGDDDNTTTDFEVPMWYYNSKLGMWDYLGVAYYTSATDVNNTTGRAFATMCITENWGEYLNLDYDFAIEQPKAVCVTATDQEGNAVTSLGITAKKDTAYETRWLNSEGKATLALTSGSTASEYAFSYSGAITGWSSVAIDNSLIVKSSTAGCDYDLALSVENPYSTIMQVTAKKIDGTVGVGYVYVYNNTYGNYFYESQYLDANGMATFKIKPDTAYVVRYATKEANVNANGSVQSPETADSRRSLSVSVQDENKAPVVYTRFNKSEISSVATTAKFSISASDANGDKVTMSSLTLNGVNLVKDTHYSVTERYTGTSYDYVYAVLDLNKTNAGSDNNLTATYSDGKSSGSSTAQLKIVPNSAPVINSTYLYSATKGYVYLTGTIDVGTYDIRSYSYDPNGDSTTTTYTLDGNVSSGVGVALATGSHTIGVSVSDGSLTTAKSYTFWVGNNPPVVSSAGAKSYLVDIGASQTVSLYAFIKDKEDGNIVTSVQAVDQNKTSYPLTYNALKGMYVSAAFTPSSIGTYTYDITATDKDGATSAPYKVKVEVIANNQKPIFTTELLSETVNVGTTKDLICVASDPEGTFVTYAWTVNGVVQGTSGTTLSQTFSTTGQVNISCTATDGDGKIATSSAVYTVVDPTVTGTLTVNTEMPGLTVALHDMTTLEPIAGQEKLTDSNGRATFSVSGDRTTFSVSLTSDTVLSSTIIVKEIRDMLISEAIYACSYSTDVNTTLLCASVDLCAISDTQSFPNWIVDLNPPTDENNTVLLTADEIDTSNDGFVDNTELYAAVLLLNDTNSDGQITLSEYDNESKVITTQMLASVPVQEYSISMFNQYQEYAQYQESIQCSDLSLKEFNLTITGLDSALSSYVNVSGNGNGYGYNSGTNSITAPVNAYSVGADGKYSFLAKLTVDTNVSFYFIEGTATELQSGLSVSVSSFDRGTSVDFVAALDTTEGSMYLSGLYKELNYYIQGDRVPNDGGYTMNIFEIPEASIAINGTKSASVDGLNLYYSHNNYYGDGTLQTVYTLADYPQLDITVSAVDKNLEFGGNDLSKVSVLTYSKTAQGDMFTLNFNIATTVVANSVQDVNLSRVLPQSVVNSVEDLERELSSIYWGESYLDMTEYKDKTEAEILSIFNTSGMDYHVWSILPSRSMHTYFYDYYNYSVAAASTQESGAKELPKLNPLSIGLDVSRLWN